MDNNELIDLTDIFDRLYRALLKLWRICLVIILICMIFFEVITLVTYHPTYTSSMTVIVSKTGNNILLSDDTTNEMNVSFQKAIMSSSMQNILMKDLEIDYLPASISVSLVPDTNFMEISATSSNKDDAYAVTQSIVKNYGQLTKLMNDANIIIIDEPEVPDGPDTTPRYIYQAIKGFIIGMVLSVLMVCICALTRRTILKEEHIKNKLHLKCLGNIPEITVKKRSYQFKEQLLCTNSRIPTYFKDSFRSLVVNMERKKDKVYMFTSTLPNEGKSTISSNVALMLANQNKKVILVDFDLRNPSLNHIFNLIETKEQLGDFLDDCYSLEHIICHSSQSENLDLILGLKSYEHSIEMLSRKKVEILIEELRKSYDYVILDVPPVLLMQDALILMKHVDASILVIKQDHAKIYEIMDALDELYEIDGNIMGCVLNSVQRSIFDEDARGYGYGYGYGKSK